MKEFRALKEYVDNSLGELETYQKDLEQKCLSDMKPRCKAFWSSLICIMNFMMMKYRKMFTKS